MDLPQKLNVVAFLDVLGFGEMVEKKFDRVGLYFKRIEDEIRAQTDRNPSIEISSIIFSDSVVLASRVNATRGTDHFCAFLVAIKNIQFELATDGIWMRGGIAIDQLHLDPINNRVAGIGMNRAYQLEKLATFPRVIIDPQILNRFKMQKREFLQQINKRESAACWGKNLIFDDSMPGLSEFPSDAFYVDYLSCMQWEDPSQVEKIKKFAIELREQCYLSQDHFLKYRWLIEYAQRSATVSPHKDVAALFSDI